jgi:hypothetical protein
VPGGIDAVEGIVADMGIEVDAAFRPDGVGLQEAAEGGGVGPRAVEIKVGLLVVAPPGEAVGGGRRADGDDPAVRGVGVLLGDEAAVVGERDDRAERVLEVVAARVRSGDGGDRLVEAGAVDEAARQIERAGADVLGELLVAERRPGGASPRA